MVGPHKSEPIGIIEANFYRPVALLVTQPAVSNY